MYLLNIMEWILRQFFMVFNNKIINFIKIGDDDQHIHSSKALKKLLQYKIGVF